ncbi:MAG: hypothetical protein US62_C0015G0014 [Candidatus Woesebacteria bacterium GW2011_GWA1_37_8]|uniref:Uncharacterized protein n=2 Tax=Candidatus Woeseibacteriota TaxID=1752722 RepID=A0A0G0PEF7_9BACT|nr:MAG: hypothetical protein US39_C0005G0023 [Microgenomates group bacterium GW2011_GWC1_37_12b]KKQ45433.1 MAG: hypothetical protein US62_C0015G0014 [Candidatus Woesebacteria bacterium GW2011_GWA1_37_8]KKQ87636.1 MAG: hypothetical protein UT10_C0003G0040 [Candidatus Woesebacteria bacterium GW2011_GWB1_38_8b]
MAEISLEERKIKELALKAQLGRNSLDYQRSRRRKHPALTFEQHLEIAQGIKREINNLIHNGRVESDFVI